MKVILALILLIKAVASDEVNTLSQIYIKKEPSTEPKGVGQFKIDFEFEVPNDLKMDDLEPINYFKLLLLPPSSLEYVDQDSEFKPLVSELTLTGLRSKSLSKSAPLEEKSVESGLGKCKKSDAEKVLSSLDDESKKSLGFIVKNDVALDILGLSLLKNVVVDIPIYKYTSKLAKGTYTWSGTFKVRKDVLRETGITMKFDEFVVGLGHFGYFINNDAMYCLTRSRTAAAIIFKRFDDLNIKVTSCDSFPMTGLDKLIESPKVMDLKLAAEYAFDSSETKLKLVFKVEVGYSIYDYASKLYNLVFTIPKEVKDTIVLGKDCSSEVTGSVPVASCAYSQEKGLITIAVSESDILPSKETTFEFDVSKALENTAPLSVNHKFIVELYPNNIEETVNVDLEKVTAAVKKAASAKPECIEPILEMAKRLKDKPEPKATLLGKKTSSEVKHEGKYILYSYDVEKKGKKFLMTIYLKNHESLKGKLNLGMYVKGVKNFLTVKEPDSLDTGTETTLVSNDGASFEFNKIQISVEFTGDTEVKKDTYFEIPVLFVSTSELEELKDPKFFRFQVDEVSGKTLFYGVYKEIKASKDETSELDRVYEQGETTVYISKFFTSLNRPAIMFKLTGLSDSMMSLLFEFKHPKGIATYGHKMITDFNYKEEVKIMNTHYYRIAMEAMNKPKTKITSTIVLEISPEEKEFSMETLKFTVLSGNEESSVLDDVKNKVLFSKVVRFVESDFKHLENSVPCLTKDTKVSTSRFRLLETGSYISARSVDCRRPWMPYVDNHASGFDINVEDDKRVTGFTLKEVISLNDPVQSRVIQKLAANKHFYKHTIYLLFDDAAVKTIKEHMIAGDMCKKSDINCPDKNHLPVLAKFVSSLLEGVDRTLVKVMVGYFEGKKLELHFSKDSEKTFELKNVKYFNGINTAREALETLLDSAFENSHSDNIGSSFSVLSVLAKEKVASIKSVLREYEIPSDPRTNNGKYPNPVYIEMIPVDEKSTFEVKEFGCDLVKMPVVAEKILKIDRKEALHHADILSRSPGDPRPGKVYTGYSFVTPSGDAEVSSSHVSKTHQEGPLELSAVSKSASGPRSPVSENLKPSSINRESYTLFFKIRNTLKPTCLKSVKPDELPLLVKLKSVMKRMESIAKSYHIIATCSAFRSDNLTKGETKYILSFKGVKLLEYSTTPTPDIADKRYSECDLFSLYKFLPFSAYSTFKEQLEKKST